MTKLEKEEIISLLNRYKLFGIKYIEPFSSTKKDTKKEDLPNDIYQLENYVNYCNICELSKFKKDSIFSIGDIDSDIMLIGTNCNFIDENINKILKDIIINVLLLDFNKVYITNILKCDIYSNIKNLDKPIKLCKNYILKQIELIKPKLIITVGSAFNNLMDNDNNILDISGNLYDYNGINLVPLLDLNFIYKNPSYKQEMFNDLKKLKRLME
ncbi:MAG: hypothetical protein DRG78_19075 [Epsilonproteobacteria bacterium]|nr:MAG: hypothetical protein DRG78_19075 [Campylobacterota bacterium]